jgi:hypothetical protein
MQHAQQHEQDVEGNQADQADQPFTQPQRHPAQFQCRHPLSWPLAQKPTEY